MAKSVRSFIAIELPGHAISSLRRLSEEFRSFGLNARWVKPGNIHLTLKFLGDVDPAQFGKIEEVMTDTAELFDAFKLNAKGVGVFPGIKKPRVIWAGITGETPVLFELQKQLVQKLEETGFPREKRSFKGHLTMGRFKGRTDASKMIEIIKNTSGFRSEPFTVDRATLFKSELKPEGAVYTRLFSAAL